ncbi:uncharacterized protein EV422DRAFT_502690 [Fimicolochytrium jonesii]|uniref:uncharacterized protein n=1 Tax=Fimicolochytrium jonesii TaxID=1396493 RepID=UPI0022FDE5B2|nr:uncharacterized protein EV422DRAFT_502690 [Fimicolochytrium jonesii]KAI8826971.1 hypothetical protein EV422DRAFT_502690 [Fimicolochytrium jonesii]
MPARRSKVAEAADKAADGSDSDVESEEALADMATSVLLAVGDEGSEHEQEGGEEGDAEEEGCAEEEGRAEEEAGEEGASAAPKKRSGKSAKRILQQEKTRMVNRMLQLLRAGDPADRFRSLSMADMAEARKTADVDMGRMREAAGAEARPGTANLLGHSAQRSLARALVDQLDPDNRRALRDDVGSISATIADVVVAEGALITAAQSLVEICRLAGEPLRLIVASSRSAGRSYLVTDCDDTARIVAGDLMGQPVDTARAARRAVDTYVGSLFVEGEKNGGKRKHRAKKDGDEKEALVAKSSLAPPTPRRQTPGAHRAHLEKQRGPPRRTSGQVQQCIRQGHQAHALALIRALTNPLLVVGWPPYSLYGHTFGKTASKEEVASFSLYWDCIQLRRREDVSIDDLFAEERPGDPLASVPGVTKNGWEGAGPTAAQIEALSGSPVSGVGEGASGKVAMEAAEGVGEEVAEKTAEKAAEKAPGEAEAGKRKRAEEGEPEQAPPEKGARPTAAAEEEGSEEEGSDEEGSDRDRNWAEDMATLSLRLTQARQTADYHGGFKGRYKATGGPEASKLLDETMHLFKSLRAQRLMAGKGARMRSGKTWQLWGRRRTAYGKATGASQMTFTRACRKRQSRYELGETRGKTTGTQTQAGRTETGQRGGVLAWQHRGARALAGGAADEHRIQCKGCPKSWAEVERGLGLPKPASVVPYARATGHGEMPGFWMPPQAVMDECARLAQYGDVGPFTLPPTVLGLYPNLKEAGSGWMGAPDMASLVGNMAGGPKSASNRLSLTTIYTYVDTLAKSAAVTQRETGQPLRRMWTAGEALLIGEGCLAPAYIHPRSGKMNAAAWTEDIRWRIMGRVRWAHVPPPIYVSHPRQQDMDSCGVLLCCMASWIIHGTVGERDAKGAPVLPATYSTSQVNVARWTIMWTILHGKASNITAVGKDQGGTEGWAAPLGDMASWVAGGRKPPAATSAATRAAESKTAEAVAGSAGGREPSVKAVGGDG